ncbi:MAG: CNNM domain-containing protein [Alphaproteobacteria bacterium]
MDTSPTIDGIVIVLLVLCSAFFSASETALTGVSRARMYALAQEGLRRAVLINRLLERKDTLISTLLLGNTFVNIAAASIATVLAVGLFGEEYGPIYATIAITLLVLVFAEVLPKTIAIYRADRAALLLVPFVAVIIRLLSPITLLVQAVARGALRLLGVDLHGGDAVTTSNEAIRGTIELHHSEGDVIKEDRDMLASVLDLSGREVGEVMTHRKQVESVDLGLEPEDIVSAAIALNHSRIPLWKDHPENIVGILHLKDLLKLVRQQKIGITREMVRRIAQKPWFVPETTGLDDQLTAFRAKRKHFACVVDEYGAWLGIVTLEDIIEEIVGEIEDEHDPLAIAEIIPYGEHAYRVAGNVTIRDLNRQLDWDLPDEFATTVAGLVLHEARVIPDKGAIFEFFGYRFTVEEKRANQVVQLLVEHLVPAEAA